MTRYRSKSTYLLLTLQWCSVSSAQREENPFFKVIRSNGAYPSLFGSASRQSFYQASYGEAESKPVLMDHFAYCMDNRVVVEAIFNVRYLQQRGKARMDICKSPVTAVLGGEKVNSTMTFDPHGHTIISVFPFKRSCHKPMQQVAVHHLVSNATYSFSPRMIPRFSEKRYHLSMCTSVAGISVDRVKMWLYYYYYHGVEHVTIMANGLYNQWKEDLQAFVARGMLEVVDMEYPNHRAFWEQQVALQICNRHYRYASQFVIYNDIDEFFLPLNTTEKVVDVLSRYDRLYPSACAFIVSSFWGSHL